MEDAGDYSCEAENNVGGIVATGTLLVHSPPQFVIRPKTQLGELGGEVIFECQATGYPEPTLFWTIEGDRSLIVPGSKIKNAEASISADGGSILSIDEITRADNGKVVVCSAVNSVGSVSTRVVLTLNLQEDTPPPIIVQGPTNQTLPIDGMALLPCRATGNPQPVISWYKDGIPIVQNERVIIDENGMLMIRELSKNDDTGLYTCVASSRSGKSNLSGYLVSLRLVLECGSEQFTHEFFFSSHPHAESRQSKESQHQILQSTRSLSLSQCARQTHPSRQAWQQLDLAVDQEQRDGKFRTRWLFD